MSGQLLLRSLFYIFSLLLLTSSLLPFIRKDHWTFRVFEFPRLQKFSLYSLLLVASFWWPMQHWSERFLLILLFGGWAYAGYLIFPFTPLAKKALSDGKRGPFSLSLLICNVYQYNTQYHKLKRRIEQHQPDILLLLETDAKWKEALAETVEAYPHHIEYPQENTYGLLFYSKYPLKQAELRFLVDAEYPSIRAQVELPNAQLVQLYGLHPPPPSPTENAYSTTRDCELMQVAEESANCSLPVIVAGDLNDVAWSFTTRKFLNTSKLLDPRKGRGIFPSFHAKNWLMRWPLDHLFCSDHFRLIQMKRMKPINSDHFPIWVELELARGMN